MVRRSPEYYNVLNKWDVERQKKLIGNVKFQTLFPAEGGGILSPGNDFGWLHYTWIDIGTPNVSFLVALDAGSDLLWVPCDCIKCAPLSGYHGSLDKDLSVYNPSNSKTSRHLPCSHKLCDQGRSCKSPKQPCPYNINYYTENTSTSGLLVEDTLYLASSGGHTSVTAPVIFGCGRMQSGGYLDGIAPDGVLGLGFGDVSVPSILATSGLVHNSFSMCFQDDNSGRILFGDRGVSNQKSTIFVPLEGKYLTYVVKVDEFCIKKECLDQTNFQALVDSGSSFTYLPNDIYRRVSLEFDRQINASRYAYDDPSWEYCYETSQLGMPAIPSLTLILAVNKSFTVSNPIFLLYDKQEEIVGFCLALQPAKQSLGIIGQNFMMGYRVVFDRESMELGWSRSNCRDLDNSKSIPLTPPSQNQTDDNQLPTNEQQSSPNSRAVSPAVASRTPNSVPSSAVHQVFSWFSCSPLLALFTVSIIGWHMFL